MRKFFIENFGCRATQADGAALENLLQERGLQRTPRHHAELVVLNTCTVTSGADADVRAAVRSVHRENPEARILVTGCYAQRAPEELAALPGVEWVVGNSHKAEIPAMVGGLPYHGGIYSGDITSSSPLLSAPAIDALADRARPNLKIQDGCNNRCAFCIIPAVRGPSRFAPADRIVQQVQELSARYREVVLTGINMGRWGRGEGSSQRLPFLLRRLLEETSIERMRLSSIEPMDWTEELIDLIAGEPRIARHVHIPLQSGSDWILRRMYRKYRPRHYRERIERIAQSLPDAAIGADVMTGFPGESDERFAESREFIASLPLTYLHVFTYSERPGTAAASMGDSVPVPIRRERTAILRKIGEEKNAAFRRRMTGESASCVTLENNPYALTSNYIQVRLIRWPGANQIVTARLGELCGNGMEEKSDFAILAR